MKKKTPRNLRNNNDYNDMISLNSAANYETSQQLSNRSMNNLTGSQLDDEVKYNDNV